MRAAAASHDGGKISAKAMNIPKVYHRRENLPQPPTLPAMRENPKADPAGALRERAGRLRAKAKHVVRQYSSREGDDAWSWLLDTAELCELAADAMNEENERLRKALRSVVHNLDGRTEPVLTEDGVVGRITNLASAPETQGKGGDA